ncbi:hypothetical protein N7501_003323 [Penicillium viridicatum]|nr:hypothetical protein N7501_003323 [Penicillium viridicatum]
MASNRVISEPSGNGQSVDKESEDENPHATSPEAVPAVAVAAAIAPAAAPAAPATTPADEPPTAESEGPSVETIEDIAKYTGYNTREAIRAVRPQRSAPGNEGSSSSRTHHHRDCIVSHAVHRHPPYLPEAPNALLGQVWIDHIDSMLGVRTERQTEDMQFCVEHTARILALANNMLRQQRELLADLRRINSEEHHSDSSSDLTDLDELMNFSDLLAMSDDDKNDGDDGDDGDGGDGDDTAASGRGTVDDQLPSYY